MSEDLPNDLALSTIADGSAVVASPLRNNFADVQTDVNALVAALSGGSSGQLFKAVDSNTVAWVDAIGSQTQTFTDSGHVDFYTGGLWLVEVIEGSDGIGYALVGLGISTASGNRWGSVLASASSGGGVTPTFSIQNADSSSTVFRVATSDASSLTVTVNYRRLTL